MLTIQQTIMPPICDDALLHIFSFLPLSENNIELVNRQWNERRRDILFFSIDSQSKLTQQAKKNWNRLTFQQQKILVCKVSICSIKDSSFAHLAKLLSTRYCGSAHEFFLRSRSWLIFQGLINQNTIQESVQQDPIWLISDYTVYFHNYLAALSKNNQKVERATRIKWPFLPLPIKEKMVIKAKALQCILLSENDEIIAKYAKKKKEKGSFFYRKLAKIEAGHKHIEAAKKFASLAGHKADNAFKSCAIRLAKQGAYEAAQEFALLAKSKTSQAYRGCAIASARNEDITIIPTFIESLKSHESIPHLINDTYTECAAVCCLNGHYKLSQYFSQLSGYSIDIANKKCAIAFVKKNNIKAAIKIASEEHSFKERIFSECAIACAERGNIDLAKKFANKFSTYREATYKQCARVSAQRGDSEAAKVFITFITYWKKDSYADCEDIFRERKETKKAKEFKQLVEGRPPKESDQKQCAIQ